MLDIVLKVMALAAFVVFLAFLPVFVPLPDLIVVAVIVVAMVTFDFLVYPVLRRHRRRRL